MSDSAQAVQTATELREAHAALEQRKKMQATPMLMHLILRLTPQTRFNVALVDGTTYRSVSADFVFADGISLVVNHRRVYFPLASIFSITVLNPDDKGEELAGSP